MWLLDANMPKQLVSTLAELGEDVRTAESQGWGHLTNGELVDAAVAGGFTRVLTRDRLFSQAAARALRRLPQFAVVLVRLPQLRAAQFVAEFRAAWACEPIRPVPGDLLRWPSA